MSKRGGERKRVVRGGFETQREAQAAMDELKGKAARGVDVASRLTLADYLRRWIAGKRDIKANTLRSYTGHIERYFVPVIGHVRLSELRVDHVAEVFEMLDEHNALCRKGRSTRPVGPASIQRIRATLRVALSDAMRQSSISTNPAALMKLPTAKRPEGLVWTEDRVRRWQAEVAKLVRSGMSLEKARIAAPTPGPVMVWRPDQLGAFLDHAHDDRLYALWHLYAFRGRRRGEAAGLEWPEVDLEGGTIAIVRQRLDIGGKAQEDTPKSDAGERIIALDAETVAALRAQLRRQRKDRRAAGSAWVESGKVFCMDDGSALNPERITDWFHELTAEAGLPPIRLHDLRHGAASLDARGGRLDEDRAGDVGPLVARPDGEHRPTTARADLRGEHPRQHAVRAPARHHPAVRGRRGHPGRPRRRPDKLHADKGYDYRRCRAYLTRRGIKVRIARRGIEDKTKLGRVRWVVERTISWLLRFKRLALRYDRTERTLAPLLTLAMVLINLRRLIQHEI